MNPEPSMKMTLSVKKEEKDIFDELCREETHGPSDQFRHILKDYLKNHNPMLWKKYKELLEK